ncbi:hypothetical protein PG990_010949 [Apiospora arundinis]
MAVRGGVVPSAGVEADAGDKGLALGVGAGAGGDLVLLVVGGGQGGGQGQEGDEEGLHGDGLGVGWL